MTTSTIAILLIGSAIAGWVDAVVGGGGLILVPLIMIMNPGFSNAQALGVNKVAGIAGTTSSAIALARKIPSARRAFPLAPFALLGAVGGALIASHLDKAIMRPIIIALLIAVGVFVAVRPNFGAASVVKQPRIWVIAALVAFLGLYDGAFGPGTGMFLIMTATTLIGTNFLASAAWAKVLNVATNLGALLTFAWQGEIFWLLGAGLAVANIVGAQIGARMVLDRGAGFVRAVLLIVVVLMAGKLALDQVGIGF